MANTKRGYEGQLFYGNAGSTAGTQITNVTDLSEDNATSRGDTTVRGSGANLPHDTSLPTSIKTTISWSMINKSNDSALTALRAAAKAGTIIALRTKDHSGGIGFDGDVTLSMRKGKPLRGIGTFEFTAEVTDDQRTPQLDV
jgi:hypothetical protein